MTSTVQQLIDDNLAVLRQGVALVSALDSAQFTENAPALALSGVGPHLRHVVDFYQRLLAAVERTELGPNEVPEVDYDARERDPRVEIDPEYATAVLRTTIERLQRAASIDRVRNDAALRVRSDGSPWVPSNVSRELQSLVSHTVHHYALIAVAVRSGGGDPGSEFGVAPSTIRYWAQQAEAKRASETCAR
ncbi:hypothetical protein Poly30_24790 [Planctomycetes bacterium Poly30]|uniref:DinB family protein n=1 Tax=Saltatorellus ferox TaxID=2528018 RepID=A0A518ES89_9BACT|nr:hypothetical protein Poly30_24790 [Planctomycetes bacterium Poly30]